jgi:sulfoxide reductase heme-binding subunit YedZ
VSRLRSAVRIAGITLVATAVGGSIGILDGRRGVSAWSLGTAYSAFFLIACALILGPLNIIWQRPNPVHSALRRDIGISAGLMAIAHTVLGLQVHMGGDLSRYFFRGSAHPSAAGDLFVAANWMGLISAVVLACVTIISTHPSLRSLGLKMWKNVQRLVYAAAPLAILHGFAYQALEKRSSAAIALVAILTMLVLGLQLAGVRAKRRNAALRSG